MEGEVEGHDVGALREQQRMTAVANGEAVARRNEIGRRTVKLDGVARAGMQRIQLGKCVEGFGESLAMRPNVIRELGKNALDFVLLLRFELAYPVAVLHRRRRLHEHRAARSRRPVHDAADAPDAFTADRNHVSTVTHGHRHVRRAVMRLQSVHHALENANQLAVRRTQLATDAAQGGRRIVLHDAILSKCALDLVLLRLGDHHAVREAAKHRANDRRPAIIAQRVPRAPRGAKQHAAGNQLLAAPHAADHPEPLNGAGELGHGLGPPRGLAAEERPHRGHAPVLCLQPREVRARHECAHARGAGRGGGPLRHQLEQPRKLENSKGVRVHRSHSRIRSCCPAPHARSR